MALTRTAVNKTTDAPKAVAPAEVIEGDVTVVEDPIAEAKARAEAQRAAAAAEATAANETAEGEVLEDHSGEIAPPPKAAAPAPLAPKQSSALAQCIVRRDVMGELEGRLAPVEYGQGVTLKTAAGVIKDGDGQSLGRKIEILLMSWNRRYVISPGEQGPAAAKLMRYSYDGVTSGQGENMADYLEWLKDPKGGNKPKATFKEYRDLVGTLVSSEKPSRHVDALVSVTCSPDTVKAFTGLATQLTVASIRGKLNLPEDLIALNLVCEVEDRSGGGNDWSRLVFKLAEKQEFVA